MKLTNCLKSTLLSLSILGMSYSTVYAQGADDQGVGTQTGMQDRGSDWGWIGLLGLVGLAGLRGAKRSDERDRSFVGSQSTARG